MSSKGSLSAVIHYPKTKTEKLAILCPGYLDSKDYKNLVGFAEELSKRGYTAVRFDPTGTWESEGDISDHTITQYLEDIKNVLEYMFQQADYKYVLLGGHSRGGMVSILYAARDSRISAVLAVVPPLSANREKVDKWKQLGFRSSLRGIEGENKKREFNVPYSYVEDMNQYDILKDVKKILVPVIFVAGELDEKVPPEDIKEIFDNANEPKRFVIIPGIGHNYHHNDRGMAIVIEKISEQLDSI